MKKKIRFLKERIDLLGSTGHYKKLYEVLNAKNDKFKTMIKKVEDDNKALEEEIKKLQEEIEQKEKELQEKNIEIEKMNSESESILLNSSNKINELSEIILNKTNEINHIFNALKAYSEEEFAKFVFLFF